MKEVVLFLQRVGWFWFLIVGGTSVSFTVFMSDFFGFGNWPRYGFLAVGVLSILGAFFRTWRDEYRARTTAEAALRAVVDAQPFPVLSTFHESGIVYLTIRNEGAQGMFVPVLHITFDETRLKSLECHWDDGQPDPGRLIAPGLEARIRLCEYVEGHRGASTEIAVWRALYRAQGTWQRRELSQRLASEPAGSERAKIRMELFADPQMRQGSEVREYEIVGDQFIDSLSGQRYKITPRDLRPKRFKTIAQSDDAV